MNKQTPIVAVETEALELRSTLSALAVTDQETYNKAVDARVKAKAWLRNAGEYFDGLVKPAYAAYKNLLDAKKAVIEPVENTVTAINRELLTWDQAQERIRREAQVKLEQEARARAEAERIQEAELLQAAGASEEAVEAVLEAPVIVTEMVAAPKTYEVSKSVVYRDNYSGEVTDLKALVKYIAKNPSFINLIQVNQTAVNQLAKSMKDTLDIPGIKVVNNKVVASGRG